MNDPQPEGHMASYIGRRKFLATLGGAAAAWPLAAWAQQLGKLPTIGFLGRTTRSAASEWTAAFVQRLRELGWTENRTVAIEYRWAEGRDERSAELIAEFVRLKVDVIVTSGTPQVVAARQTTSIIPIVFATAGTRSAAALPRGWRGPGATPPAFRLSMPNLLASGSNFCARSSPVSAGWRSWAMSAIPSPCWSWARFRRRPGRSVSKSPHSKSEKHRISRPPSRRSRAARTRFMSVSTRS